jgi:2',3'-cyclic-nucleotide 2'-phosphodiesterase (5'-nucleotidase family)
MSPNIVCVADEMNQDPDVAARSAERPRRSGPAVILGSCLLLGALLAPALARAACDPSQALTLLHFNDIHGQLEPYEDPRDGTERGGMARLAATVAEVRAEDPSRPVVLLFAGDLLQGTLTSSLFLGVPDVVLLGRIGVDAAVMGNHELDYGQEVFRRLTEEAEFPFLSANVASDPQPLTVLSSVVIERPDVPKVAVLGLTTPELTTATHPRNIEGISVEEPVAVARRLVPALRDEADLVVVLSHLGIADDRRLAESVPGIDLIVGGHNHNLYARPVFVETVPIVQAGERGGWLGRMDFRCREGRLAATDYTLIPIDSASPEDPEIAAEVRRITLDAERELDSEVGFNAQELSAWRELIRREEASFGNFVADLAREITLADIALFNGGSFRASIPAGPVTLKSIYQAFPFRNELVLGELSGARLLAALERSAALNPLDNPGGFLQVSGVSYRIENGQLASATIDNVPIDPTRRYRIVTSDFLAAGGDGYDMLEAMTEPVMTGRLISDMVVEGFRTQSPVNVKTDGRITRH